MALLSSVERLIQPTIADRFFPRSTISHLAQYDFKAVPLGPRQQAGIRRVHGALATGSRVERARGQIGELRRARWRSQTSTPDLGTEAM